VSTTAENRVKIVEQVKSAGTIQAILVNPKRSVVTQQMEHLLRIWLDDQAYRCRPVSQATTSANAKSLECYKMPYEEKKKVALQL
jgi:hypothetical protein